MEMTKIAFISTMEGSPWGGSEGLWSQTALRLVVAGRIRYIEQANAGQAAARNRGLAEAQGEFIAFLDDDDLWPPDKLEWQIAEMNNHSEAGMIGGSLVLIDASATLTELVPTILEATHDSLFRQNPFISSGQTLIRASVLKQVHGLNMKIRVADDWDLWFRIAKCSTIVAIDRLALLYRVHPNNASKQAEVMLSNCCAVVDLHLKDVEKHKRKSLRAVSYQGLYGYFGRNLIDQTKQAIKEGRISVLPTHFTTLSKLFIKVIFIHPKYIYLILCDLLPKPIRRRFAIMKVGIRKFSH